MAARKQKTKFKPKKRAPTESHVYAEFMGELLDGTIHPDKLTETRDAQGRLELEYEEPDD